MQTEGKVDAGTDAIPVHASVLARIYEEGATTARGMNDDNMIKGLLAIASHMVTHSDIRISDPRAYAALNCGRPSCTVDPVAMQESHSSHSYQHTHKG